jgi:hypothetical protein
MAGAELGDGELAQVQQEHDGAVGVDGRAADGGQPAEEPAEVLDDELELALERVHGPGQLLARPAVPHDDRDPLARSPGTSSAPPRSAIGMVRPCRMITGAPATVWVTLSRRFSVSTTLVTGSAYRSSPSRATRQRMTPRVTGSVMTNVVPVPGSVSTSTEPPRSSTAVARRRGRCRGRRSR